MFAWNLATNTYTTVSHTGADLGFFEGVAKPSSESLKQGIWDYAPQKLYKAVWFLKHQNLLFDGLLKEFNKIYVLYIEVGGVVGATPQKV